MSSRHANAHDFDDYRWSSRICGLDWLLGLSVAPINGAALKAACAERHLEE